MADSSIEDEKAALRITARATRAAIPDSTRAAAAKSAAAHFFASIPLADGQVVAGYWRIKDEMDCQPILIRLMDSLQPVCLPVVLGDELPLELRLWEQGASLYEAGFGTLAPAESAPQAEPDLIIVPLLAFDAQGTRLGYGGGYYDRTFATMSKRPLLVGLAFNAQELPRIPRIDHDVPLDAVVTEHGVRSFGSRIAT